MSITYTVEKKKILLKFIVSWKHGNTLLSGIFSISSFYVYAFFSKFSQPP